MTYIPEALRRLVAARAQERCEYCQVHADDVFFAHEIDHIYAEKHGGATVESNLCLACIDCNRYKGTDLASLDPESGEVVVLFHPRRDRWRDHFLLLETGVIAALSSQGRVTARLLQFNRLDLIADRGRLIRLGRYGADVLET